MKSLLRAFGFLPSLLFAQTAFGQDSAPKVAVVVSPALLMPVSVAAQAGLQFRLGKKISLLAEGAFPTFYPKNTPYERLRYWRTGLEARYAYRREASVHRYVAVQAAYLFRELTDKEQAFYYTKAQTFSYTNAVIHSPVLSSALKLGMELSPGRRFFVDAFLGGGVRWVFTSYTTKAPLVTSLEPKKQTLFTFDDAWLYNYTLMRLHAVAGLRVGVRL